MAHTYEQNAKPAHLVSAMLILNFSHVKLKIIGFRYYLHVGKNLQEDKKICVMDHPFG